MSSWGSNRSRPESYSGILILEALAVAGAGAYYLYEQGVDTAWAVGIWLVATLAIRQVLVYVDAAFWLWTLAVAGLAAHFTHRWYVEQVGNGDGLLWSVGAFVVLVLVHLIARFHSRRDDHFWW